jgi:hypothetical protein
MTALLRRPRDLWRGGFAFRALGGQNTFGDPGMQRLQMRDWVAADDPAWLEPPLPQRIGEATAYWMRD